jgi:hypothetical protein
MTPMYSTLIMLKPRFSFTPDDLHRLVQDVAASSQRTVDRSGNRLRLSGRSGSIDITFNGASYVIRESDEIAVRFGVPSNGCESRFEMAGDDPEMELFNDYLLINERLQEMGGFVIFDTQECKLLFE